MVKHLSFILVKKHLVGCPLCEKNTTGSLHRFSQRGAGLSGSVSVLPKRDKAPTECNVFLFSLSLSLRDGHPGRSVGQSVEEPVDQRGRRYQVLQLQVEDPLKALGPLGAELCPQTQDAIQWGRHLG